MKEGILVALVAIVGICQGFNNVGNIRVQTGLNTKRMSSLKMVISWTVVDIPSFITSGRDRKSVV